LPLLTKKVSMFSQMVNPSTVSVQNKR
jgi:hypothetical protein